MVQQRKWNPLTIKIVIMELLSSAVFCMSYTIIVTSQHLTILALLAHTAAFFFSHILSVVRLCTPMCTTAVSRRYSGGTPAVLRRYSGGTPAVLRRYSGGTPAVLRRYSGGTPAVLRRYFGGTPAVHEDFNLIYERASWCAPANIVHWMTPEVFLLTQYL